ncbi:hypothetical protein KP509_02G034300 [Ceratopteris richardii]|uniref:Uncharacterized protein n=1 Tax=Ceratopteris richardii TaxID=49495 RepID=A0A8T2V7R8_CERRI|nr:hypothetical protein KP509_02G034300 [Ceratopteris richardii]
MIHREELPESFQFCWLYFSILRERITACHSSPLSRMKRQLWGRAAKCHLQTSFHLTLRATREGEKEPRRSHDVS